VELHHKLNRLVGEKRWVEVQELLSDEAEMIIQSAETLKEKLSEELSREVGPWLKEFSLWGRLMGKIAELIFSADITFETIEEVRDLCDEVESILVDLVRAETITAGVLFRDLAQEILIRTKGYLTLLIASVHHTQKFAE
jgi:hyaluronoglucosaminidase